MSSDPHSGSSIGLSGSLAKLFINSKLTPLLIIASVLLGVLAVALLPREEEPQIKVPMVDVMVSAPGYSSKEIENRVCAPLEKLVWEIPGVEYVYSISRPEEALVIVRFVVGEDIERSLVKLNQKLQSNFDRIPPGVSPPILKPRSIDDVPVLAITFHSAQEDHATLRRVASEIEDQIKQIPDVSETNILGGMRRQFRVQLNPGALASLQLDPLSVVAKLQQANRESRAGSLIQQNRDVIIETDGFFASVADVENTVIAIREGTPIYLRDIATVVDGPEELKQVVVFGSGAGDSLDIDDQAAVTLTIAKRAGTNAIAVASKVLEKVRLLTPKYIPHNIQTTVTRHYGETAEEKSNELLLHMLLAIVSVSFLILLSLGWRESIIVALAIPSTLSLTLLVFYLDGFTLNRITLFALIFSIGILVDDAIVVVENITRHLQMAVNKGRALTSVAIEAVSEVGNPTILATWAVIAAVFPMAFVGGLMGPYMRPIPIGATAAMLFSLLIAFIVTPWAAVRVLRWGRGNADMSHGDDHREGPATRMYRVVMNALIQKKTHRWLFLGSTVVALCLAMGLVVIGWVQVKMLPFDNKNEFQIILNMPEGSSLEKTVEAGREILASIKNEPEVVNYQLYAGISSPYNFNGLVRHYFLRSGPHVADIQVNLLGKHERTAQSHEIAKRVRPRIQKIASKYHASVAIAEVPPGPPVLQTLVAEIYGPTDSSRSKLAATVKQVFSTTPGVVDIDTYEEADQRSYAFVIDHEKASLSGISADVIAKTLQLAVKGIQIDIVHLQNEKEDVALLVELPRSEKTSQQDLLGIKLQTMLVSPAGKSSSPIMLPISEFVQVEERIADKAIYRKNMLPVTYVIGDVANEIESPGYAIFTMNKQLNALDMREYGGSTASLAIRNASAPFATLEPSLKWDGEWHITLEVFRDLGFAFLVVLVLIYILMVGWFKSLMTPIVVMAAIPFSLIGIMPAHGAMGAFFTATSMIGFMAGAGIVIRNSIILVDFIELRLEQGLPLAQAVVDAGAIRFRPMLLTAAAVIVGASVILFDPIFQGLAIALMAGEVASLLISRMAVPVLYYMANKKKYAHVVAGQDFE